jgi:hypothetical protein
VDGREHRKERRSALTKEASNYLGKLRTAQGQVLDSFEAYIEAGVSDREMNERAESLLRIAIEDLTHAANGLRLICNHKTRTLSLEVDDAYRDALAKLIARNRLMDYASEPDHIKFEEFVSRDAAFSAVPEKLESLRAEISEQLTVELRS